MPVGAEFFHYFAYGSNMSFIRLGAVGRAPSAQFVAGASLVGHRLTFDKVSRDGSGKADCERTGDVLDVVYGGLFLISQSDRLSLDKAEGLGTGYEALTVRVKLATDEEVSALTYVATHKDVRLKPFSWYVRHVLVGAQDCKLPTDYIARIGKVVTQADSNLEREARELGIYITPAPGPDA